MKNNNGIKGFKLWLLYKPCTSTIHKGYVDDHGQRGHNIFEEEKNNFKDETDHVSGHYHDKLLCSHYRLFHYHCQRVEERSGIQHSAVI